MISSWPEFYNAIAARLIGPEPLLQIYKTILTARLLDQKLTSMYKNGILPKAIYSEIGQEAGPAVISYFLNQDDRLIPYYRGYAAVVGKGLDICKIIAEVLGKESGAAKGKGGFGNFMSTDHNIYPYSDILGQSFAMALGMGLASKYREEKNINVIIFGDGTTTPGRFYSALNLAALWHLPILFVCVNNQYSMMTKFSTMSLSGLSDKVKSFKIKFVRLDGNNVLSLYRPAENLVNFVRENKKPAFVELLTFRVVGHSLDDSASYIDKEELMKWKLADPIRILSRALVNSGLVNTTALDDIMRDVSSRIDLFVADAKNSKPPTFADLEKEVYA